MHSSSAVACKGQQNSCATLRQAELLRCGMWLQSCCVAFVRTNCAMYRDIPVAHHSTAAHLPGCKGLLNSSVPQYDRPALQTLFMRLLSR